MPATDHQSSFLTRISIRRNQVVSMNENSSDQELNDVELFQTNVADHLAGIFSGDGGSSPSDAVLSVAWFRKLLDVFLCCEEEFNAVLLSGRDPTRLYKPPADRVLQEYVDRLVKALDICNAVTNAVDTVRQWQKLAEIVVAALELEQVTRAKKALNALLTCMGFDDKDTQTARSADRNWSVAIQRFRSLSFSLSNSWSSTKQIQLMSTNLIATRGMEPAGLAVPVYTLSKLLVFIMWALVVAFPCLDRAGLPAHFSLGKQLGWAKPIISMQEKISEELRKKYKKMMSGGLLEETQRMEKVAVSLVELMNLSNFPVEVADEMAVQVAELAEICRKMDEGLGALQQEIRKMFHRIVKSRAEVVYVVDQISVSVISN